MSIKARGRILRCPECDSVKLEKSGVSWSKGRILRQRYQCNSCGRCTIYPKGVKDGVKV